MAQIEITALALMNHPVSIIVKGWQMDINALDWLDEGPATPEEVLAQINRDCRDKDDLDPSPITLLLNLAVNRGFAWWTKMAG